MIRNETWVTQIPLPFTLFTVNQVFHSTCYLFPSLSETMHFLMDASRLHHAPAKLSLRLCNPATHSTETSKAFARLPLSFPSQAPRGDGHAQHWRLSSLSSIFSFQYTINLCVHQRHIWLLLRTSKEGNLGQKHSEIFFLKTATVTKHSKACYVSAHVMCSKQAVLCCLRGP